MCTVLPCCNSQNWERQVYLKQAPKDYEGKVIKVKKDTVFNAEDWAEKTDFLDPGSVGKRLIPKGTYVADKNVKGKKFFVVEEVNGTYNRDIGFGADNQGAVVTKALLATAVAYVPIYTLVTMFINLIKIPLNVVAAVKNIFNAVITGLEDKGVNEAIFAFVRRSFVDLTVPLASGIWGVLRCPLYGLAIQAALIYTIFCPYEGRQVVADLERAWHYPCTFKDDLARMSNPPIKGFDDLITTLNKKVIFSFFCFQPTGSWKDEKDEKGKKRYIALEKA